MAKNKYFLGSVGTAEAFRRVNGKLVLAFRSKTLTDSGLNISTTKDDIRAGTGAPIQFSFYHDPSVEITLTDVLFDENYIAAQLGADFETGGDAYMSESNKGHEGTSFTLAKDPLPFNIGCGESEVVIWFSEQGKDDWARVPEADVSGKQISNLDANKTYCFRYLAFDQNAKVAEISSEILPQELFLVITAPIFSGDACSASNGKKAGTITYEIPRFKLNGAQDFTMNMSSNQTMSLSGIALASESGCEMTGSNLLRIIAQYTSEFWYSDADALMSDEAYEAAGEEPHIYAVYKNGTASLIDNDSLVFGTGALTEGLWNQGGPWTVTAKRDDADTSTEALPSISVTIA